MKLNKKLKRVVIAKNSAFKKSIRRGFKVVVFRNAYSKVVRKYAKMEARRALKLGFRFVQTQIAIRPRIRLISKVTLALLIALFLTNIGSNYLKAKEADIKVNGQAVLVATKADAVNAADEETVEAVISSKRSPFDFRMPVDGGQITQGFSSYHRANDIAVNYDSPIYSLGDGKVEFAGFIVDGRGNTVVVDHGDGLKTLYAHMHNIKVNIGEQVSGTTVIGSVGLSGRTTGSHVHVEVYDGGLSINPASVLPAN